MDFLRRLLQLHRPRKGPTDDEVQFEDNVEVVLRGPDGKVKQREKVHNILTTVGKEALLDRQLASPAIGVITHMAVGTGTEEAKVGDTTLKTELKRIAVSAKERAAKVLTIKALFAAGEGTGALTEGGTFNASSAGNMFTRAVWSVVNKGAEDTLEIIWTITAE